jgi:DNA-binding CsgD family transcriptional regulator
MIALAALRTKTVSTAQHHDLRGQSMEATDCISPAIIAALDYLDIGLLLVTAEARVCFVNRRAEELMQSQELNLFGGQLRAASLNQTSTLHELIGRHARANGEIAPSADHCHRIGRLMLQFAPVTAPHGSRRDTAAFDPRAAEPRSLQPRRLVAIFVVNSDDMSHPTPQQLQLQFALTPAEAELACEIVKGEGLVACARNMGITRATASTHLQRIFEKTGTKRQAQLVRRLLTVRPAIRAVPARPLPFPPRPHPNG